MSVLDPLSHALAAIFSAAYTGFTLLGADPAAGTTWVLCIATVVLVVRMALLPLVIHGVRQTHASAKGRPQLQALAQRYRTRTDRASLRAYMDERRRISVEHGISRLGFVPLVVQLPLWWALYHVLAHAAAGAPIGAVNVALVASLGAATFLGVPLTARGYLGAGWLHLVVVAGLACVAAGLSFVTQQYFVAPNTVLPAGPELMGKVQQMMPALCAVGLLIAGGIVPVALLIYWMCNQAWTLGQSAVVWRWFPTPGSPAARHRGPQDPHLLS